MASPEKRKRIVLILLAELLILAAAAGFVFYRHSQAGKTEAPPQADKTEDQTEAADAPSATILFASDYQPEDGFAAPSDTLSGIIDAAENDGKNISAVVMCGDYSNEYRKYDYQISPEPSIAEIRDIVSQKISETASDGSIFVQGNHDALTDSLAESGLHEYDDYLVYVLNTQNDFPWKQGRTAGSLAKVKRSSEEMKECFDKLIADGETRPVIIAGHVPLHFTARTSSKHSTGDNLYSSLIFDVVNEAGRSLDIVYMFGHNHSKGWDCYLGGAAVYKPAGDTILIPAFDEKDITTDSFTEETLDFTYMNAGYAGYYLNCSDQDDRSGYDAADMTLTGTVCEVWPDRLVLTRYDSEGVHNIGADGEGNPYKGGIDEGLISSDHYSTAMKSPQTVTRKNK